MPSFISIFLLAMPLFGQPHPKHLGLITIALSLNLFLIVVNSSMETSKQENSSSSDVDPYKALHIILNPNGTLTRLDTPPKSLPSPDPTLHTPILSKDLTINPSKPTWARIYLPHKALDNPPHNKLPFIVFYHGGGFIFYSAASTYFHDFCVRMANATQSVVVSVEYRLAPEHRLPAAYEDSVEALHWIRASNDLWLAYADYSRVYLMGESAGGNIAYNAGLRAAAEVDKIKPLNIQGLILIQPFFGGTHRTPSELRLAKDGTLPLVITDLMWNLSLPAGANRDHEYSNPTENRGAVWDMIRGLEWKVVVFGCGGDPLVDRERELVNLLKKNGVDVMGHYYGGGRHGIFVGEPSMSTKVYNFVNGLH